MRRIFGMLALLALALPFVAFAGGPGAVAPQSAVAVDQFLTPQEIAAGTSTDAQLDVYFLSKHIDAPITLSGGGVVYPATWVCSISCTACGGTGGCGNHMGICRPNCP